MKNNHHVRNNYYNDYHVRNNYYNDYHVRNSCAISGSAMVNNLPADARDARDAGSIPRSGRSPEVGNGNLLQYSYLENSIDREA